MATKAPSLYFTRSGLGVAESKEAMHRPCVQVTLCPCAGGAEDVEGEQGEDGLDHGGLSVKEGPTMTSSKEIT